MPSTSSNTRGYVRTTRCEVLEASYHAPIELLRNILAKLSGSAHILECLVDFLLSFSTNSLIYLDCERKIPSLVV